MNMSIEIFMVIGAFVILAGIIYWRRSKKSNGSNGTGSDGKNTRLK